MRRDCKIVDHPKGIDALSQHSTDKYDLVLLVRRPHASKAKRNPSFPIKTYADRSEANRALKTDKAH